MASRSPAAIRDIRPSSDVACSGTEPERIAPGTAGWVKSTYMGHLHLDAPMSLPGSRQRGCDQGHTAQPTLSIHEFWLPLDPPEHVDGGRRSPENTVLSAYGLFPREMLNREPPRRPLRLPAGSGRAPCCREKSGT